MKPYIYIIVFFFSQTCFAQKNVQVADSFKIVTPTDSSIITVDAIKKIPTQKLSDLRLTNHHGEFKKILKKLEGIPIKTFLEKIQPVNAKPKELNEYYYIFRAGDDFINVYSWNEIFNTAVGDSIYIITSYDGFTLDTMPDKIMVVSLSDNTIARRMLKGLRRVEVCRVKKE